jgi:hypothetical protein
MAYKMRAIDVHGHYGVYDQYPNMYTRHEMPDPGNSEQTEMQIYLYSGDPEEVVSRANEASITRTIVSPLQSILPKSKEDILAGNRHALQVTTQFPELLQYVVIHPDIEETYRQAEQMLKSKNCVGIKIHPERHAYSIREHGDRIFAFAAKHNTVVLAHSGEQRSLPGDMVEFADRYPEMKLIVAHLGCGWDGDKTYQVRAIQKSKNHNIYTDTSSAQSITPRLIEWAVSEIGSERILFGTDTPLYFTMMHRIRIECGQLSDSIKEDIFYRNAERLFKMEA